ncbi:MULTISPECIES: glutaminase A [unclassified Streptomyces]|uniref:glutaminase A n=1 Tax=unclassified Streptomyces TaxID=2593676 RepID=UPI00136B4B5E|nr:glutaminase A [Streptomyces sp. PsTaAH-137]MYT69006.1 glutaminase A [Streptomyces sp. SID8367]
MRHDQQGPPGDPLSGLLDQVRSSLRDLGGGAPASYIPELSRVDPDLFGLSLCALDGQVYGSGDTQAPFTVQSVSKPFVFALALADRGLEEVLTRVGAEPSGEAFNSIRLEPGTGRPPNPMVNAGAIVTTSLVAGDTPEARFDRILDGLSAFAARPLAVDEAVYASERATGDRNRALAYLMHNAGSLTGDVEDQLDVYFRQCSVLVTSDDLAVMHATLAAGGINPVSGDRVVAPRHAQHVLAVMATCGMYDASGQWMLQVGMPAKSGVSGAIGVALPGQFGIGVFSPPLEEKGNSVRGIAACHLLSDQFGLHLMRASVPERRPMPPRSLDPAPLRSLRHRPRDQRAALEAHPNRIRVHVMQGDLDFATAEQTLRAARELPAAVGWFALDLTRVGRIEPVAADLLRALGQDLGRRDVRMVLADPDQRQAMVHAADEFPDLGRALESCEDAFLSGLGLDPAAPVPLADCDLFGRVDPELRALLADAFDTLRLADGESVAPPARQLRERIVLWYVESGRLAVCADAAKAVPALRTWSAGPGAALTPADFPARITRRVLAESDTVCRTLTASGLVRLRSLAPDAVAHLERAPLEGADTVDRPDGG